MYWPIIRRHMCMSMCTQVFENLREEIEELEDYVEYVSGYAPEKDF